MATGQYGEEPSQPASILAKAFTILDTFTAERRVQTLGEIARLSGLPKSTVHRLLGRLVGLGVLDCRGSTYTIGARVRALVSAAPNESLRQSGLPHLAALQRWGGGDVRMAALRSTNVLIVEQLSSGSSTVSAVYPGQALPAHATALGKALLAHEPPEVLAALGSRPLVALTPRTITDPAVLLTQLREVRDQGIARSDGESYPDVHCVAAPVMIRGRAVGAVSVSLPGNAENNEQDRKLVEALTVTAERIARDNARIVAQGNEIWLPTMDF